MVLPSGFRLKYFVQFSYMFGITHKLEHMALEIFFFFCHGATARSGPGAPHYQGFTIILKHTTYVRTPLDEWSARRLDLYLTTRYTHERQTSMTPAGFEPPILTSERPLGSAFTDNHAFKYNSSSSSGATTSIVEFYGLLNI